MTVIAIRADADSSIGAGHLMRCLAIAQAARDVAVRCVLISERLPESLRARFELEGVTVVTIAGSGSEADADATADVAKTHGAEWCVVDGYHFSGAFCSGLRKRGVRVLLLDDDPVRTGVAADVVLNPNLHAARELYADWDVGDLLLGAKYLPLRREFATRTGAARDRIVLTMGGADPVDFTTFALDALRDERLTMPLSLIVGGQNPRGDAISAAARRMASPVEVLHDIRDMAPVLERAAAALSAAGSTAWELAALGVPAALVSIADNQRPVAREVARRGAGIDLGSWDQTTPGAVRDAVARLTRDPDSARAMSVRANDLVDGRGASRVVEYLLRKD